MYRWPICYCWRCGQGSCGMSNAEGSKSYGICCCRCITNALLPYKQNFSHGCKHLGSSLP